MAPPAWRPAGCSGSRFGCLSDLEAAPSGLEEFGEELDEAHVSVQVALGSMDAEVSRRSTSPISRRPRRTDAELRQEFWADAGFPTPASWFWERGSTSGDGENPNDSIVRRSPPLVDPVASSRRRRSGTASSPAGLRLSRSPPRMGPWRGPLPPRRISPPPILGDFLAKAGGVLQPIARPERPLPVMNPAAPVVASTGDGDPVFPATCDAGVDVFQTLAVTPRRAHRDPIDRVRPGSWEHLHRRFKVFWSRSKPASSSIDLPPPPPSRTSPLHRPAAPPSSSSTPSSTPSPSRSPASLPRPPRWTRSFAAVVAAHSASRMAGAPHRPSSAGGAGGGPSRPPASGLL